MSETPSGEDARRIVDELEDEIVDVDEAQRNAGVSDEELRADDTTGDVPGSPEPAD